MRNKKKVVLLEMFVCFKKNMIIEVEDHDGNDKVYITRESGSKLYVPKLIVRDATVEEYEIKSKIKGQPPMTTDALAKAATTTAPKQAREKVFGNDSAAPPVTPEGMSAEEAAVIDSLMYDKGMEAQEDREVGSGFQPDNSMTVEEKARLAEAARLKKVRAKLTYTGEPRLKEGQFWLTDLTEGHTPDSGVDHVVQVHCMMHWIKSDQDGKWYMQINEDYHWFNDPEHTFTDIPEIDEWYLWDADVLESVIISYKLGEKLLLTGPPGTGKTSAVKQFAAWTDHPYMRFNGKDGIEQSSFLGYNWVSHGTMTWRDGLLPQGLKLGYLICIDEVFKIPPGIQMAMQSLYERGGTLMLDDKAGSLYDKTVTPHPACRLMLTDNVKGTGDASEMFAATQMQDTSTIDRFGITQDVGYLEQSDEVYMLRRKYPDIPPTTVKQFVQFANMIRGEYMSGRMALTLSPRGLIVAMDLMESQGLGSKSAVKYSFVNKISDDTEKNFITQSLKTCFR